MATDITNYCKNLLKEVHSYIYGELTSIESEFPSFSISDFSTIGDWYINTFKADVWGTDKQALHDFYNFLKQGNNFFLNTKKTAHVALAGYLLVQKYKKPISEIINLKNICEIKNATKIIVAESNFDTIVTGERKRNYKLYLNPENFKRVIAISSRNHTENAIVKPEQEIENNFFQKLIISEIAKSTTAENFYNGIAPTWADIAAEFDYTRKLTKQIISDISAKFENTQTKELKLILVSGTAGAGKTTILKRVAYDLASKSYAVYYLVNKNYKKEDLQKITTEALSLLKEKNTLIVVDDIFKKNLMDIQYIFETPCDSNSIVIFSEHSAVFKFQNKDIIKLLNTNAYCTQYKCDFLHESDVAEFSEKITSLEESKKILKPDNVSLLSTSEKIELCLNRADMRLFVTLLQLRNGKPFKQIIQAECEDIITDRQLRELYKAICFFDSANAYIPETLIYSVYEGVYDDFLSLKGNMIKDDDIDFSLKARHPLIAREVLEIFKKDTISNYNLLLKLFQGLDLANSEDEIEFFKNIFNRSSENYLLLSTLLNNNPEKLVQFLTIVNRTFSDKFKTKRIYRIVLHRYIAFIIGEHLKEWNYAEEVIYSSLDNRDTLNRSKEEKKQLASFMMDRALNQRNKSDIEEAYKFSVKAVIYAENSFKEDKNNLAYFYSQHAITLTRMPVKFFLQADEYFTLYFKNITTPSSKIIKAKNKYKKIQEIILANRSRFPDEAIPINTEENEILFNNPIAYKIINKKTDLTINEVENISEVLSWAEDNLNEEQLSRLYANTGRQLYTFKTDGLLPNIQDIDIEEYYKKSIDCQIGFNSVVHLYYADLLKDIHGRENETLRLLQKIDKHYLQAEPNKMLRRQLYIEGFRNYLEASVLVSMYERNQIEDLSHAKDILTQSLNNFSLLLKEHTMGYESRIEDYKRKLGLIRELLKRLNSKLSL